MDAMVCSSLSGFVEYSDVDRVVGAGCGVVLVHLLSYGGLRGDL